MSSEGINAQKDFVFKKERIFIVAFFFKFYSEYHRYFRKFVFVFICGNIG